MQTAIVAGGCFWCLEAVFSSLKGVTAVKSGYTAGHTEQPTYAQVCTGNTGHTEAVKIDFDEHSISYADILNIFFLSDQHIFTIIFNIKFNNIKVN